MRIQRWLLFAISFLLVSTLFINYVLIVTTIDISNRDNIHLGSATQGVVSFCINVPVLVNNTCPTQWNQSLIYECYVNASDADNDTLIFSNYFYTNYSLFSINNETGLINFTANQTFVGNHSTQIVVDDQVGCSNSMNTTVFNIEILNVNDAPYLVQNIPDQTFLQSSLLTGIYLDDYFRDPDGDDLTFFAIGQTNIIVSINQITSQVTFTSPLWCGGTESIIFSAVDPGNLSANSNIVSVEVTCPQDSSAGGDGTGGGGGGGGGRIDDCEPQWECYPWSACYLNNTKKRRCVDINGCDENNYIQWFWENCTFRDVGCQENWVCQDWGSCIGGWENRSCEDINECGTFTTMPNITQSCVVNATCTNGIQDIGEEGVDCGGSCPPCSIQEQPLDLGSPEYKLLTTILLIGLLVVAMALLMYRLYYKQINRFFVRVGWMLTHRHRKIILLTPDLKKKLLEELVTFEKRLQTHSLPELAVQYGSLARIYVAAVLKLDVSYRFEQVKKAMETSKLPVLFKKTLAPLFTHANHIEFGTYKVQKDELLTLVDQLRTFVFMTAITTAEEAAELVKERHIMREGSHIHHFFIKASNAFIALQYFELAVAKKMYLDLYGVYERLPDQHKAIAYRYLQELYDMIKYGISLES